MSTKVGMPAWRDSPDVCALADGERHLGHIIRDREWIAFDATHADDNGAGIRQLGSFSSIMSAKEAVEQSIALRGDQAHRLRAAAVGTSIQ